MSIITAIDGGFGDDFAAAYRDQAQRLGRFNLAVFGKTGAGKSSLVNAIFGQAVAQTGIGKPVTTGTTYYEHPSGTFGMFDCVGFETGESGDDILDSLRRTVNEYRDRPLNDQMHVAWYVLRWSDRRFEDSQAAFVRELRAIGLPVILVLSQVPMLATGELHPEAQELAATISAEMADVIVGGRVVLTNAIEDPYLYQPVHGLMALLDSTFRAAPEGVRLALTAAQRIDLERKRTASKRIVATATTVAAGIGATPIPFSDAALLIPAQVTMMATIATRYALPVSAKTVTNLAIAAAAAGGLASWAGRSLSNVAKFIPGIGSVVGGATNAAIAASLTTGIGMAWITVCERLSSLNSDEIEDLLGDGSMLRSTFLDAFKEAVRKPLGMLNTPQPDAA
jgi:uncharacterized protein (DUF697 family)/GTP-binding protein EngB required for normal cell division